MCMIEGGEVAEVWNESTRVAKKAHRCCECGRVICVGERYHYVFGVGDGDRFYEKWCAHCEVAKEWLWKNCGGHIVTCLLEDIEQHVEEYRRWDLARLAVAMRRKWARFHKPGLLPPMPVPRPLKLGDHR